MLVNVEDLEKGDEVLIGCGGGMRYLKLLNTPKIGKRKHWHTGNPMYVSVKCLTNVVSTPRNAMRWQNGQRVTTIVYDNKFILSGDNLNTEIRVDFNYKQCWLIKKDFE